MKDPGYISERAWNQEHPYGDFCGYDLEQDQRWDRVAGNDFYPDDSFLPNPDFAPGRSTGTADRGVTSPLDPAGTAMPAGSSSS